MAGFNPCFSGSCSRIQLDGLPALSEAIVSILVLVDLAREFIQVDIKHGTNICFNPCFSGSCSRMPKRD